MSKNIKILACITGILFIGGVFFKIMHWQGSSILYILTDFVFNFFYLPFWLMERLKRKEFKYYYWSQFFMLIFQFQGLLFKIMHWPLANLFLNISYISLILFLPILIFKFKSSKDANTDIYHTGLLFLLLIGFITYIRFSNVGGSALSLSFSIDSERARIENSLTKMKIKSDRLYQSFDLLNNKVTNPYYKKSQILKQTTDSTIDYVSNLKSYLVSEVDSDKFDALKFNSDISTSILFGEMSFGSHKSYTAKELKKRIEIFRDSMINLVNSEQKNIIKQGINLSTENLIIQNENVTWEEAFFYEEPLVFVLNTLTAIEYEVKNAETQILTDLLNNATAGDKTNLASQIAELGLKYETHKKEQQLALMQKDKELSLVKMKEKQKELDNLIIIIGIFILATLIFLVMLFYIIRSNLIRRKLFKELAAQKHEIEEKNKELNFQNEELNQKNEEIRTQSEEIEAQRDALSHQKDEIISSIQYAQRIQHAVLPDDEIIKENLPEFFVLYKPRDIVSGDFYWFKKIKNFALLATADCTGHGVPGAFMSMLGISLLNEIVGKSRMDTAGEILNNLRKKIKTVLHQHGKNLEQKDGMDIALCIFDLENNTMQFAGAYNSLYLVRNNQLIEFKADRQPCAVHIQESDFTTHEIKIQKDDIIYTFSDGYADQYGGENRKKYLAKNFRNYLLRICNEPMEKQKELLDRNIETWKNGREQIDDITVVGVKI